MANYGARPFSLVFKYTGENPIPAHMPVAIEKVGEHFEVACQAVEAPIMVITSALIAPHPMPKPQSFVEVGKYGVDAQNSEHVSIKHTIWDPFVVNAMRQRGRVRGSGVYTAWPGRKKGVDEEWYFVSVGRLVMNTNDVELNANNRSAQQQGRFTVNVSRDYFYKLKGEAQAYMPKISRYEQLALAAAKYVIAKGQISYLSKIVNTAKFFMGAANRIVQSQNDKAETLELPIAKIDASTYFKLNLDFFGDANYPYGAIEELYNDEAVQGVSWRDIVDRVSDGEFMKRLEEAADADEYDARDADDTFFFGTSSLNNDRTVLEQTLSENITKGLLAISEVVANMPIADESYTIPSSESAKDTFKTRIDALKSEIEAGLKHINVIRTTVGELIKSYENERNPLYKNEGRVDEYKDIKNVFESKATQLMSFLKKTKAKIEELGKLEGARGVNPPAKERRRGDARPLDLSLQSPAVEAKSKFDLVLDAQARITIIAEWVEDLSELDELTASVRSKMTLIIDQCHMIRNLLTDLKLRSPETTGRNKIYFDFEALQNACLAEADLLAERTISNVNMIQLRERSKPFSDENLLNLVRRKNGLIKDWVKREIAIDTGFDIQSSNPDLGTDPNTVPLSVTPLEETQIREYRNEKEKHAHVYFLMRIWRELTSIQQALDFSQNPDVETSTEAQSERDFITNRLETQKHAVDKIGQEIIVLLIRLDSNSEFTTRFVKPLVEFMRDYKETTNEYAAFVITVQNNYRDLGQIEQAYDRYVQEFNTLVDTFGEFIKLYNDLWVDGIGNVDQENPWQGVIEGSVLDKEILRSLYGVWSAVWTTGNKFLEESRDTVVKYKDILDAEQRRKAEALRDQRLLEESVRLASADSNLSDLGNDYDQMDADVLNASDARQPALNASSGATPGGATPLRIQEGDEALPPEVATPSRIPVKEEDIDQTVLSVIANRPSVERENESQSISELSSPRTPSVHEDDPTSAAPLSSTDQTSFAQSTPAKSNLTPVDLSALIGGIVPPPSPIESVSQRAASASAQQEQKRLNQEIAERPETSVGDTTGNDNRSVGESDVSSASEAYDNTLDNSSLRLSKLGSLTQRQLPPSAGKSSVEISRSQSTFTDSFLKNELLSSVDAGLSSLGPTDLFESSENSLLNTSFEEVRKNKNNMRQTVLHLSLEYDSFQEFTEISFSEAFMRVNECLEICNEKSELEKPETLKKMTNTQALLDRILEAARIKSEDNVKEWNTIRNVLERLSKTSDEGEFNKLLNDSNYGLNSKPWPTLVPHTVYVAVILKDYVEALNNLATRVYTENKSSVKEKLRFISVSGLKEMQSANERLSDESKYASYEKLRPFFSHTLKLGSTSTSALFDGIQKALASQPKECTKYANNLHEEMKALKPILDDVVNTIKSKLEKTSFDHSEAYNRELFLRELRENSERYSDFDKEYDSLEVKRKNILACVSSLESVAPLFKSQTNLDATAKACKELGNVQRWDATKDSIIVLKSMTNVVYTIVLYEDKLLKPKSVQREFDADIEKYDKVLKKYEGILKTTAPQRRFSLRSASNKNKFMVDQIKRLVNEIMALNQKKEQQKAQKNAASFLAADNPLLTAGESTVGSSVSESNAYDADQSLFFDSFDGARSDDDSESGDLEEGSNASTFLKERIMALQQRDTNFDLKGLPGHYQNLIREFETKYDFMVTQSDILVEARNRVWNTLLFISSDNEQSLERLETLQSTIDDAKEAYETNLNVAVLKFQELDKINAPETNDFDSIALFDEVKAVYSGYEKRMYYFKDALGDYTNTLKHIIADLKQLFSHRQILEDVLKEMLGSQTVPSAELYQQYEHESQFIENILIRIEQNYSVPDVKYILGGLKPQRLTQGLVDEMNAIREQIQDHIKNINTSSNIGSTPVYNAPVASVSVESTPGPLRRSPDGEVFINAASAFGAYDNRPLTNTPSGLSGDDEISFNPRTYRHNTELATRNAEENREVPVPLLESGSESPATEEFVNIVLPDLPNIEIPESPATNYKTAFQELRDVYKTIQRDTNIIISEVESIQEKLDAFETADKDNLILRVRSNNIVAAQEDLERQFAAFDAICNTVVDDISKNDKLVDKSKRDYMSFIETFYEYNNQAKQKTAQLLSKQLVPSIVSLDELLNFKDSITVSMPKETGNSEDNLNETSIQKFGEVGEWFDSNAKALNLFSLVKAQEWFATKWRENGGDDYNLLDSGDDAD